ncbi:MAG: VWA domain-containing protein [Vicinamibacterales bacterium]
MKYKYVFTVLVGACFCAVLSGSQAPAPPAIGQEPPDFRVAVDLVTTDVIPRDARGQFVADLKKEDFEVYEDGVMQDITSVVLIHGGRVYNQVLPPPPPPQEGIILPPTRPMNDTAGRIMVLFVDDLHMQFRDTARIRDLFKRIGKTLIHEGDLYGIVSTGPSSLSIDLTYDRTRLDEAIKKISGSGLKPSEIISGPESSQGPTELRYRAHVAFSTVYELLKNMEKVTNRRKAILYVSSGYDFNPFAAARAGLPEGSPFLSRPGAQHNPNDPLGSNDPTRQGQQFADADLALELNEVTRAANRANATLYTIDPRGLVAGPDLDEEVDPQEWNKYVMRTQDSLRMMAENTGGIAVVNSNDFDKFLKRIDNETSDYYVLGYTSRNPDPTRRTRRIEVKVSRPDLTVWSRTSYSLRPTPQPASPQ